MLCDTGLALELEGTSRPRLPKGRVSSAQGLALLPPPQCSPTNCGLLGCVKSTWGSLQGFWVVSPRHRPLTLTSLPFHSKDDDNATMAKSSGSS